MELPKVLTEKFVEAIPEKNWEAFAKKEFDIKR